MKVAIAAFSAKSSETVIRGMTSVLSDVDSKVVVQVCSAWGGTPPHRAWFVVDDETGEVSGVEFDFVSRHFDIATWR
jgi:hypothetical protein